MPWWWKRRDKTRRLADPTTVAKGTIYRILHDRSRDVHMIEFEVAPQMVRFDLDSNTSLRMQQVLAEMRAITGDDELLFVVSCAFLADTLGAVVTTRGASYSDTVPNPRAAAIEHVMFGTIVMKSVGV